MNSRATESRRRQRAVDAIDRAIEEKKDLPVECLAENLRGLVTEIKGKSGKSMGEIAKLVGHGEVSGSSKNLHNYMISPKFKGDRRNKKISNLAVKLQEYKNIAIKLARITGEDEQLYIIRTFGGSGYGESEIESVDWKTGPWENLADLLRHMAQFVIQKADLQTYWAELSKLPGLYNVRTGTITASPGTLYSPFSLAANCICSDEVAPIPSVPLARHLQAAPTNGWLVLGDGQKQIASFTLWREVRLALGPVWASDQIGPLLETRTVLEAELPGQGVVCFDNPFTDGSDHIERALLNGESYPVRVAAPEFPRPSEGQIEHSYFAWHELSVPTLRRLLSLSAHDRNIPMAAWSINHDPDLGIMERPPSWFSTDEPAYLVETALHTGSLERALLAECQRLSSAVCAHKAEMADLIREQSRRTLERWQQSANTKSDKEDTP